MRIALYFIRFEKPLVDSEFIQSKAGARYRRNALLPHEVMTGHSDEYASRLASMKRIEQATLIVSFVAFSWLMMQAVHELGHISASLATGTEIIKVRLYPTIISETEVWEPPHPLIEVWAGPLTGMLLPLVAFLIARMLRSPGIYLFRFFAGFCLIVNGVYVAFGPTGNGADTAVMIEHGTPRWLMILVGVVAASFGLYLWHRQGRHFGLGEAKGQVDRVATITSTLLLLAIVAVELFANSR